MNILVTGARAPIAADIAKALTLAGHAVWVADSARFPVAAVSPHIRGFLRLPAPRADFRAFADRLVAVCAEHAITSIVPTSEEVIWLARAAPRLPKSIALRASPFSVLVDLHHKGTFAALAVRLGHGAPENHELIHADDLTRFTAPERFVFKPVYSRFATRTLIGPTVRALSRVTPSPAQPWLAQTLVRGRELCAYNIADAGRLILHVAYEPQFRFGVGASTYFSPVVSEPLRALCARFIAATGFTGQISFDVIETQTGLVAIECNPRGTSGVHLAAQQPAAFAAAFLGQVAEPAPLVSPEPRMLLLPLLLNHPGALLRSRDRARLRAGKDALHAAGISVFAQTAALAEMAWQAARLGVGLSAASTSDFEWNGEPPRG
jgi:hypothetical protein